MYYKQDKIILSIFNIRSHEEKKISKTKGCFFFIHKLLTHTWWVLNPPPHPPSCFYKKGVPFELEFIAKTKGPYMTSLY